MIPKGFLHMHDCNNWHHCHESMSLGLLYHIKYTSFWDTLYYELLSVTCSWTNPSCIFFSRAMVEVNSCVKDLLPSCDISMIQGWQGLENAFEYMCGREGVEGMCVYSEAMLVFAEGNLTHLMPTFPISMQSFAQREIWQLQVTECYRMLHTYCVWCDRSTLPQNTPNRSNLLKYSPMCKN